MNKHRSDRPAKQPPHRARPSTPSKSGPSGPKPRPQLYGFHAVREAWLNPAREVQTLYLAPQALGGFAASLEAAKTKALRRPGVTEIDKTALDRLLPPGAVHQGIALACAPLPELDEQDLLIRLEGRPDARIALLDQVTDPHNVGAILRSACAFGLDGLILQKKHAPALEGVLAKTACGALEHTPIAQATNLSRAIETLKDAGFFILGLDEHAHAPPIQAAGRIAMVLGSEGEGLRRLVRESCDSLISLPTSGPIASLNVSNAAAVAFYALKKAKN